MDDRGRKEHIVKPAGSELPPGRARRLEGLAAHDETIEATVVQPVSRQRISRRTDVAITFGSGGRGRATRGSDGRRAAQRASE